MLLAPTIEYLDPELINSVWTKYLKN